MQRVLSYLALFCGLGVLMFASPASLPSAQADEISKATLDAVSGATFEVVVLKSTEDHLTYERPLPLDLIPFNIRNDPYYSVGTAFATGANQWVTAGHVFDLGHKSLLKTLRLRDQAGKVYDIDKILKYSMRRDFVVFSLKSPPAIKPLAINTAPSLNDKVYTVGNALGEGIVFRDGLYTSATPEAQDGEWKWMRFSAAASPGNSGGPLLDLQGRVVGIVIGKSENENLNYALPIGEVQRAKDAVADLDNVMMKYKIDNIPNQSLTERMHKQIALPMPYPELDAKLASERYAFGKKLEDDFFAQQRDHLFPNGKESLPLLYSDFDSVVPGLVAKGDDGIWDSYTPQKPTTNDVGVNGYVTYGSLGESDMLYFHKPDGVEVGALFKDSKLLMDNLLQGYPLYRKMAGEQIKVVSMGRAAEEYSYSDHYGRKWLVRIWNADYSDRQVVLFALPVPGGFAGMVRIEPVAQMAGNVDDLKALTDFACVSYYGTLEEWRDLLSHRDLLPKAFGDINVDIEYGKRFRYASKRLSFSYSPAEMHITEKSDLRLNFAYFPENGKTVWDVTEVVAGDNKDNSTFFSVARHMQPAKQLDDKYKSEWEKMAQREYPYNKSAYFNDKRTVIGDTYMRNRAAGQASGAPLLYSVFYGVEGNIEQNIVQTKLDHFVEKLVVTEN